MKHLNWVFISSLILASCGTSKTTGSVADIPSVTTPKQTTTSQKDAVAIHPNRRAVFHESRTLYNDIIHTKLELKPDWQKAYMYGTATITAKPHFYDQNTLVLDAKGMEIKSVKLKGNALTYTYKDDVLTINLDKTYTRTEQYTLVIDYVSKPEERTTGGSAAINSDKGLYFINPRGDQGNQMPQIWTQGETQSNSVWFPTIDSPNAKSTQEIYITVEDKYVTLSNGKLISSKKNADGTRTDYWKQDLKHAPYLFMLGIGEFKVVKDYYTRPDGSKMEVFYYVEPEWEQYARDIFGETPAMIRFFSQRLGVEYPWDKYHQIVVRDYVSGAMENTGAVVFGDFVYKTKQELVDAHEQSIIAHELFHHWFGDLVTAESWSNLALNEAFANYSQYLWDEHRHGKDVADLNAAKEESGYMAQANSTGHHDLIWYDYKSREDMFDGHTYNKGGRILHMLRNYVGDDAFFTALKKYLSDNAYKAAEHNHLRLAFEEVTGEDLNWFFNQWFLAKGHPSLEYSYKQDNDTLYISAKQKQDLGQMPIYKLPQVFAVKDDSGLNTHRLTLSSIDTTFAVPVKGKVITVVPDFDEVILSTTKDTKDADMFVEQYYVGKNWRTRNNALINGYRSSKFQQLVLDAMNDPFYAIRAKAMDYSSRLRDENIAKAKEIMASKVNTDPAPTARVAAVNALAKLNYDGIVEVCKERIQKDSSFAVIGAALKILNQKDPAAGMAMVEDLEKMKSGVIDVEIANMYVENEDPRAFEFMKNALMSGRVTGFNEVGMLNLITTYGAKSGIDELDKVVDVMNSVKVNGGMYAKMFIKSNFGYILTSLNQAEEQVKTMISNGQMDKKEGEEYLAKFRALIEKVKVD